MGNYSNTGEFLAAKFPNVPKDWLEEVNQELGTCGGNARMTTQFSDGQNQWTDWTKRILGKLRPKRHQK